MPARFHRASTPLLAIVICLSCPAAVGFAPAGASARATAADSLASVIPDSVVVVEVLTPDYSRRVEELAVRMNTAARQNPQWFQSYMRSHPGTPPWSPNFGVTLAEYQEYLSASRTSTWKVRERATLRFARVLGTRRWTLHGWGVLTPLDGTVLDLDAMRVASRKGLLEYIGIAEPQTSQGALDWRWFGTWKASHRVGDPRAGGQSLDVSLHLGPLSDGRNAALYWTSRRVNSGQKLEDQFLLLRYPLAR